MRSFIIRTICYISVVGIILTLILWYFLVQYNTGKLWIEITAFLLSEIIIITLVILFLRRFLNRQFDLLYKLLNGGRLTEKELGTLSGQQGIMSNISREMIAWSQTKASEIDQLKQMEKYRKEFLGNVSHELKTPVFNIQGYILTLLEGGLEDKSVNRLYLERSEKSINRMIHIIEDLESIAGLESGELQLKEKAFDITHLTAEIFESHEMSANEHKIKFSLHQKPVWVYADRKRIMEVMDNLIANSIKYGRKNGTTTVSFSEKDNLVSISVADNGIGIEEKELKRIFERFYRCDKSRSREQGGTGLGLSIVKHIMEAHSQTIRVQSVPGKGTTFTFTLPKYDHSNQP